MKHRKYCYTNFIKRIYIAICARDTYYAKVKKIYEIINLMRGCIMTRVLFLDLVKLLVHKKGRSIHSYRKYFVTDY